MRTFLHHFRTQALAMALGLGVALAPARAQQAPGDQPAQDANAAPLTQATLLKLVGDELTHHFDIQGELKLELLRPFAAPSTRATSWSLAVSEYPQAVASTMILRTNLVADGRALSDVTLLLRGSLWTDCWITGEQLKAGTNFDPAMLSTRPVDLLRDPDAVPTTAGGDAYIFARSVSAGRILTWHDLGRRPLVRRGSVVEVTAAEGTLVITMKALAMQNGAEGDPVTVRNLESHRDFTAFVTDENRVQVHF